MGNVGKVVLGGFIWVICGTISIVAVDGGLSAGSVITVMTALSAGLIATHTMFGEHTYNQTQSDVVLEKAKRDGNPQMDLLLSMMDEEEQAQFKQELKQRLLESTARLSDDGEVPMSLDEMMSQSQEKKLRS